MSRLCTTSQHSSLKLNPVFPPCRIQLRRTNLQRSSKTWTIQRWYYIRPLKACCSEEKSSILSWSAAMTSACPARCSTNKPERRIPVAASCNGHAALASRPCNIDVLTCIILSRLPRTHPENSFTHVIKSWRLQLSAGLWLIVSDNGLDSFIFRFLCVVFGAVRSLWHASCSAQACKQ